MAGEIKRLEFSEGVETTKPTNLVPNTPDGLETVAIDNTDSPITLVVNRRYFADTTSGTIAATMPVGASTGDRIQIVDNGNEFDTNAMTVTAGVGDTVDNAASDELKKEGEVVEYVYDSAGTNWVKLAFGSGGGLTNDGIQRTAAFTADAQNEYFLKTDAGAFQIELPPIAAGNKVKLIDSTGFWSTNPPTVVDNGGTGFNGVVGSPLELNVGGSWIEFSANIDDSQWEVSGPTQLDEFSATVPVVEEWTPITLTPTNITESSQSFFYKRSGDTMILRGTATLSGAASGNVTYNLPGGFTIDYSKLPLASFATLGVCSALDIGGPTGRHIGVALTNGSSTASIVFSGDDGQDLWNATVPFTWAASDRIEIQNIQIPIVEWPVNQVAGVIGEATSTEAGLLASHQIESLTTLPTGAGAAPTNSLITIEKINSTVTITAKVTTDSSGSLAQITWASIIPAELRPQNDQFNWCLFNTPSNYVVIGEAESSGAFKMFMRTVNGGIANRNFDNSTTFTASVSYVLEQ